ncbi:acetoacetate decarboxylase family protein [uncultured Jatrophihabitans sp.]|uniref:acetoacetate decarboxylase family protein n=1 Tax=uncultured Jatrophihabitans sp. TaxID=1610747 RepID=UPI0035CB0CF5
MTDYPPQPWDLRGQMYASTFLLPLADIPVVTPPGWSPVRLGGRGVVATAWVDYEPSGVLSYRELMATLLVHRGRLVAPTILAIWVDSESSRYGGRGLWAIPKELATFDFGNGLLSAACPDGTPIATGTVRRRAALPRPVPLNYSVVQERGGAELRSPVRSRGTLAYGSATFDAAPNGPLGWLAGRRPTTSVQLADFEMSFGTSGAADSGVPRR